jgi:predicted O-methyltransferase YrrM
VLSYYLGGKTIRIKKRGSPHAWQGFDPHTLNKVDINKINDFMNQLITNFINCNTHELVARCKTEEQVTYASSEIGEHYKLLQALAKTKPGAIVTEVGTSSGMSSLQFLTGGAQVNTFDLLEWELFPNTVLSREYFVNNKISQHIADLSDYRIFLSFQDLLTASDLIFIDGPKDGKFEKTFISNLLSLDLKKGCIIVCDDIYFSSMIELWKDINLPKFDISVIGHATGTGIIFPNSFFTQHT